MTFHLNHTRGRIQPSKEGELTGITPFVQQSNDGSPVTAATVTTKAKNNSFYKCWCLANIRSIHNKLHDFFLFVDFHKPVFICLTETWLSSTIPDSLFCPTGYTAVRCDRTSRGGGVSFLIHDSIRFRQVVISPSENHVEMVAIDILGSSMVRVIGYYRPPGLTPMAVAYGEQSCLVLHDILNVSYPVCLMGDFNLPNFDWLNYSAPNNPVYNSFLNLFNEFGLHQFVSSPTRDKTILDLVLSDDPTFISRMELCEPISSSDHNSVLFFPCGSYSKTRTRSNQTFLDFRKADYTSLNSYLMTIPWNSVFQHCFDVEQCWLAFKTHIAAAIDRFVPVRSRKRAYKSHPPHLMKLFRTKSHYWRRLRTTRSSPDRIKYKQVKTLCTKQVKKHQLSIERSLVQGCQWGRFYRHVNKKLKTTSSVRHLLRPDNSLTDDTQEITDIFNQYFSSVFTNDNNHTPNFPLRSEDIMGRPDFSPEAVFRVLRALPRTYSSGPDGLPNILLQSCASALALPLSHIFSTSFLDSRLPMDWKTAVILPIHKKGSTSDPSNHRPISISSTCCRVMERLVNISIQQHLIQNSLISPHQHGFMPSRSACGGLMESTWDWVQGLLSASGFTDVVYLDFRKAFDTVSHPKLLCKLLSYGIQDLNFQWIKDFLSDRTQYVQLEGVCSSPSPVTSGVPQGSVLGPTLFLVFINDILDHMNGLPITCKLYADDLKIYCHPNTPNQASALQSSLTAIYEWSCIWQLQLAADKCKVCRFGRGRSHSSPKYSLMIGDCELSWVTDMRDLGVLVDPSLKFDHHIAAISRRAATLSHLIRKCFISRDQALLTKAYVTYIRPILEYCTPVWSPHYSYLVNALERVQRRFTKSIPVISNRSYSERLELLGLQTLEYRRRVSDLVFCFKIINEKIKCSPSNFPNFNENTRLRGHHLKLCFSSAMPIDVAKFHFCNRIILSWNALPPDVVSAKTADGFKRAIERILPDPRGCLVFT